ncbi:hypothetical protein L6R52_39400 [Myxococcota bacterium]|nr:hypothetical protein [Myxococcota bacterium]
MRTSEALRDLALDADVERFERRQHRARRIYAGVGAVLAALTLLFSAAILGPRDGVLFRGFARAGLAPGWAEALEDAERARTAAASALARGDLASVERAAELYAQAMRAHPQDPELTGGRVRALTAQAAHLARLAAQDRAASLRAPLAERQRLRARAHTYDVAIDAILRESAQLTPWVDHPDARPELSERRPRVAR